MKLPNLWSWWTQRKNFLLLFLNLDTVLLDSTPLKFANIWHIKWNWIWSMKFAETAGIQFLTDVFDLLSSRNFATMATWHNDLFSLLLPWVPEICSRVWRGASSAAGRHVFGLRPKTRPKPETAHEKSLAPRVLYYWIWLSNDLHLQIMQQLIQLLFNRCYAACS